jgi:solute carrier family 25 (mitochondrial folate transporter), member 32
MYRSIWSALNKIIQYEGFHVLFNGLGASMLGISHTIIFFPLYEGCKKWLKRNDPSKSLSTYQIFFSATLSKIITSSLTYPHEVIRARSQDFRRGDEGNARLSTIIS